MRLLNHASSLTISILLALAACSSEDLKSTADSQIQNTDATVELAAGTKEPAATDSPILPRKVDLIIVMDTSGDMNWVQTTLNQSMEHLFNGLDAGRLVDYRVGVLLAHVGTHAGRLYSNNLPERCFLRANHNPAQLSQILASIVNNAPAEEVSDGGEAGIYSLNKSISDSVILASNRASGCFRPDADLITLFITTENDISTAPDAVNDPACDGRNYNFSPTGPAIVRDLQCTEQHARARHYSTFDLSTGRYDLAISESSVYQAMRQFQGSKSYVPALIGFTGVVPPTLITEAERAYGYLEHVQRGGGETADLAAISDPLHFFSSVYDLGVRIARKFVRNVARQADAT